MILLLIFIVAAAVVAMLTGVGISLQGGTGGAGFPSRVAPGVGRCFRFRKAERTNR